MSELTQEQAQRILQQQLVKYIDYAGQYDILPKIARLSKEAGIVYPERTNVVYRAVPGLDDYPYTEEEIIEQEVESEIVSTSYEKTSAMEFIEETAADWGYLLTYHVTSDSIVADFDYLVEEYGWDEIDRDEKEILIDVEKSNLINIEKVR